MPKSCKKIVILGPTPPPYMGPSIATEIILKSKLSSEFDLIHLDTSDRRELSNLGKIDFWNIYLALKHYVQLFWLLLTKQPAIVYIPVSQTTVGYLRDAGFLLITKLFKKKVVCHLRGSNFLSWLDHTGKVMQWFVFSVHRLADAQIVLGKNLQYIFKDIIPADRIFVVPNGANFHFNVTSNSNEKINVLFLANFLRAKGVLDTLFAAEMVSFKNKHVYFNFAGAWIEDDTKHEFNRFLKKNPDIPVNIVGKVRDNVKLELYRSADIFVFPPNKPEGHPWVIIEAMAAGLPIITTNQGAIPESVIDGVNGFLVEKKSPEAIAEKIELLVRDKYLRMRMGRASRQRYLDEFTEDRMVEKLAAVFYKVMSS